jgi:hypothetical protein
MNMGAPMSYFLLKAVISGLLVAAASETARRYPGIGALIASLPLVSVLGMLWLWRDTKDVPRMVDHSIATFWYVLPSLPMFLLVPVLMKRGVAFAPALLAGCLLTVGLYVSMTMVLAKFGFRL